MVSISSSGVPPNSHPEPSGVSLQAVVHDAQDLLIIAVAGDGIRQLVQVDHLIEADKQPCKPSQADKSGHQLQRVVDAGIVDDGADTQGSPGVGPGSELAAKPADGIRHELVVTALVAIPVLADDLSEVVAADHL